MSDIAIQVEHLSKKYTLGAAQQRHDTLRDLLVDSARGLLRRKPRTDETTLWALRDVSFDIQRGEVVGVIGRNGAGKSTLLKILSRITEPTSGRALINGRVGSLLEVGTGFHPELTGRENIYLNGAILGMRRKEIERKFDEIVAFAEIERFLDTPVKRYSSGMYVRLAFAVAAHLEPEILLVDEVLAVGDAAFQKKCLGKMGDVAKEGRTVLFVSHNMAAIQRLCKLSLLLQKGQLVSFSNSQNVILEYLSNGSMNSAPSTWIDVRELDRVGNGKARFVSVRYSGVNKENGFKPYSKGVLEIQVKIDSKMSFFASGLAVIIYDQLGNKLMNADIISHEESAILYKGENLFRFTIEQVQLAEGVYSLGLWLANANGNEVIDFISTGISLEIIKFDEEGFGIRADGLVVCDFTFEKLK